MTTKGASTMPKTEYVIEPGKQEIISTTVFDAPRELVFKAYTDPELVVQWFGPRKYETKIYKFEPHAGGSWRMSNIGSDGAEHIFRGVNHEVVQPERICSTWEYEGVPGHVLLNTTTFEELGNKTRAVEQLLFQSVADRDGMVASGMQEGADESVERLVELLEKMKIAR